MVRVDAQGVGLVKGNAVVEEAPRLVDSANDQDIDHVFLRVGC